LSQTVQFLSRLTTFAAGGGIETGVRHVRPPSIDRFTNTVGTAPPFGRIGIDEISHVAWRASKATLASLTASNGLPTAPDVEVIPGRKP
jgi:hypothetical protein